MTLSQIESHERHKRFHRAIARRAILVKPKIVPRSYAIPNKPFGVAKIPPPIILYRYDAFWDCMWFFDLIKVRPRSTQFGPSVERIQKIVAAHFGVTQLHVTGWRRTKDCVGPRHIAMYLARVMVKKSFPEIGRRFGDRDHTSVLYAVDKIAKRIEKDEVFAAEITAIKCKVMA